VSANLRGNWFLAVRLNLALQRLEVSSGYRLSNPKEMDFFFMRRMLQHDLDWYEAHFESEDGLGPRPVREEISPIYGRLKAWQGLDHEDKMAIIALRRRQSDVSALPAGKTADQRLY
jgi:hypothetical protein